MNTLRNCACLFCLIAIVGCSKSGGGGGLFGNDSSNASNPVIQASQVETQKLQEAVKSEPIYKIEDAEIELLQKEGIITEADVAQLKAIK